MADQPKPQVTGQQPPKPASQSPEGKTLFRKAWDSAVNAMQNPVCNTVGAFPGFGPLLGQGCRTAVQISEAQAEAQRKKPGQLSQPGCTRQQSANLAPNQDSPSCSSQPLFRPSLGTGVIQGNPLNDYINVQYHVSLTAISELSTRRIQPDLVSQKLSCGGYNDEMQQAIRKDGSFTLASTGEVFRNQGADVAFERIEPFSVTQQGIDNLVEGLDDTNKKIKEAQSKSTILGDLKPSTTTTTADLGGIGGGIPARAPANWRPPSRDEREKAKNDLALLQAEKVRQERLLTQLRSQRRAERAELIDTRLQELEDRRYYNIKNLSIANVMSPTKYNRMMSNMVGLEMTLVEPHGFQLHEDIKRIAVALGYDGVHEHRVVWRIDVHFSGYDQDTGEYVPFIPISPRVNQETGCNGSVVSYYVTINRMTAKTTHQGTEYQIKFSPQGTMALRPEDIMFEACSIERGQTFGDFLKNLSAHLEKYKRDQVKKPGADRSEDFTVDRIYEFIAPAELTEQPWPSAPGESAEHDTSEDPSKGGVYQYEKGISVMTAVERAMYDLRKVQDDFLRADESNEEFIEPRVTYNLRVNAIYDEKNPNINDYKSIRFQYIIEPHLSYKDFTPSSNRQITKALSLQARLKRLREMIAYGMIQRKYDYLFTESNTEVINLNLDFSAFYYKTLNQDDTNSEAHAAGSTKEAAKNKVEKDQKTNNLNQSRDQTGVLSRLDDDPALKARVESNINDTLLRLFGKTPSNVITQASAEDYLGLMSMALTPAQKNVGSKSANRSDSIEDGKFNRKNLFLREIDDNLETDLLRIEMDVRGDPIYFYSPYASEALDILEPLNAIRFTNLGASTGTNPDSGKLGVQPTAAKCIFLRILAPNQTDFMNPDRQWSTSRETIIGGFYELLRVESSLEGGKFTQKLIARKIANLNYLANNIDLFEKQVTTRNPDDTGYEDDA